MLGHTGRALAQVIEAHHQHQSAFGAIRQNINARPILQGQVRAVQKAHVALAHVDLDVRRVGVSILQRGNHLVHVEAKLSGGQRDLHHGAALVGHDGGHEDGVFVQIGERLDFGNVAMGLVQTKQAVAEGLVFGLGNHFLAARCDAADGGDGDVRLVFNTAQGQGFHEGTQEQHGAGGVAAGVGHARRGCNGAGVVRVELGQTVHPVGVGAVRGRGIQDTQVRVLRCFLREFDGSVLWQTKDREIGTAKNLLAMNGRCVPGQTQHGQAVDGMQALRKVQPHGTAASDDDHGGLLHGFSRA